MDTLKNWLMAHQADVVGFFIHLFTACGLVIIGYFTARLVASSVTGVLRLRQVEPIVTDFTGHIVRYCILIIFVIAAIGQLGVQTTSLIAVLGAAGLAIGLALQGTLSNFASGVLLIVFRPIKANEYIEIGNIAGTVLNIHIFSTTLLTADNKTVIMPNNQLFQGNIINYSRQGTRRINFQIGISYESDLRKAKAVLYTILRQHPQVLVEPEPLVGVFELADSSVILNVRPWVRAADYWPVYYQLLESIKLGLDTHGITIPYPQMRVHMANKTETKTD